MATAKKPAAKKPPSKKAPNPTRAAATARPQREVFPPLMAKARPRSRSRAPQTTEQKVEAAAANFRRELERIGVSVVEMELTNVGPTAGREIIGLPVSHGTIEPTKQAKQIQATEKVKTSEVPDWLGRVVQTLGIVDGAVTRMIERLEAAGVVRGQPLGNGSDSGAGEAAGPSTAVAQKLAEVDAKLWGINSALGSLDLRLEL